jgi:hypothetical protein
LEVKSIRIHLSLEELRKTVKANDLAFSLQLLATNFFASTYLVASKLETWKLEGFKCLKPNFDLFWSFEALKL